MRPPRSLRADYRARAAGVGLVTLVLAACCGLLALLGETWGLSLPFTGSCAGCAARGSDQAFAAYLVTAAHSGDRALLDPAFAADPAARQVTRLLYDGLVTLDKNLKPEPWGAEKVDVSPDGLTYIFHLRPDQRFSDGTPVQASDYAWSLERLLSPCVRATTGAALLALRDAPTFAAEPCAGGKPSGHLPTLIGDSILPDDGARTLALVVAQPTGGFLTTLAAAPAYALERGVVNAPRNTKGGSWPGNLAHGATGQGGSGMFYLAGIAKGGLTLRPNPVWWGQGERRAPNLSEVDLKLSGDAGSAYKAFQADPTAAYLAQIPADQLPTATSDPGFREGPALRMEGIAFNWSVPPFDDLSARKAFCLAINRDQYAATQSAGSLEPTWHVTPLGMPGYDRGLTTLENAPTTGDVGLARQDWQAYLDTLAGQKPPRITFSFASDSPAARALATSLQAEWSATLGVTAGLAGASSDVLAGMVRGKGVQIFNVEWGSDVPDPRFFLTQPFSSGGPRNVNNAGVPEADALLAQADIAADPMHEVARMQIYNQAEQYLVDNVVVCPLAQRHLEYELRPWVQGIWVTPDGLISLDYWSGALLTKQKPQDTATPTKGA